MPIIQIIINRFNANR